MEDKIDLTGYILCFDCEKIYTKIADLDSCAECDCRYTPNQNGNGENCPECNCPDYNNHCPVCDSNNIDFVENLIEDKI